VTEVLSVLEPVAVSAAAALTAFFAWRGVDTWRRQLKGQTEYEAARVALRSAYRVRDALSMVRSPFMSSGEQASAVSEVDAESRELDPSSSEARARSLAAAYQVRWRVVASALSDLDVARVEAEALWGSSAAACFKDLRACAQELNAMLTMYLRHEAEPYRTAPPGDFDEQVFRTVFGGGEGDAYAEKVLHSLEAVETFFRPKLR
jgi:hypothetical protein